MPNPGDLIIPNAEYTIRVSPEPDGYYTSKCFSLTMKKSTIIEVVNVMDAFNMLVWFPVEKAYAVVNAHTTWYKTVYTQNEI